MNRPFYKLIDIAIALIFILIAYSAMNTLSGIGIDLPYVGLLLALVYIAIAFGFLRNIPQVKYLVHANTSITVLLLIALGVFSLYKGAFYYLIFIPIIIHLSISVYAYKRFKSAIFNSSVPRELSYFVIFILTLIGVIYILGSLFEWPIQTHTLSGPILLSE